MGGDQISGRVRVTSGASTGSARRAIRNAASDACYTNYLKTLRPLLGNLRFRAIYWNTKRPASHQEVNMSQGAINW